MLIFCGYEDIKNLTLKHKKDKIYLCNTCPGFCTRRPYRMSYQTILLMIQIDNTIVSLDVFEDFFACDLAVCRGACCIEGDGGAPLTENEINQLEDGLEALLPFMTEAGVAAVRANGVFTIDSDGDHVTTLVREGPDRDACAFACTENGIRHCAVEKAQRAGAVPFAKPVSCHLYPIRITAYKDFDAINVHHWDICACARRNGQALQMPLYRFLKTPLIRKYGAEWYEKLLAAAEYVRQFRNGQA